jgi:hypothetical protein
LASDLVQFWNPRRTPEPFAWSSQMYCLSGRVSSLHKNNLSTENSAVIPGFLSPQFSLHLWQAVFSEALKNTHHNEAPHLPRITPLIQRAQDWGMYSDHETDSTCPLKLISRIPLQLPARNTLDLYFVSARPSCSIRATIGRWRGHLRFIMGIQS